MVRLIEAAVEQASNTALLTVQRQRSRGDERYDLHQQDLPVGLTLLRIGIDIFEKHFSAVSVREQSPVRAVCSLTQPASIDSWTSSCKADLKELACDLLGRRLIGQRGS